MRKFVTSLMISVFLLPSSVIADDDDRCEDGDCCVGLIAFCDNEFPLLPPEKG